MSDCDWVLPFRDRKHDSVDLVDRDRAVHLPSPDVIFIMVEIVVDSLRERFLPAFGQV